MSPPRPRGLRRTAPIAPAGALGLHGPLRRSPHRPWAYAHSLERADPDVVEAARIPVERIPGDLVLVAGGDDKVWPALPMARRILDRRRAHGLDTTLVEDPRAGHPIVLPEEATPDLARPYQVGGDSGGPVRLGELAWPAVARVLGFRA